MIDYKYIWSSFFSHDVDEIGKATDECVYAFLEKFKEVDERLDKIEAALGTKSKAEPTPTPSIIMPDIEISKKSVRQARQELIKELQKEFSR